MDKNKAFEIWEELYGDRTTAYDFASHPMKKEDYQNKDSHYGWDIDEKKPYLNREDNYLPCSINSIKFRQKKNSFKVGNNLFEVRKGKVHGTFSIYDITDRNNPINTDPTEENQEPDYNRERFHNIAMSKGNSTNNGFRILNPKSIMDNVLNQKLEENDVTVDDYSFLFDEEENHDTETAEQTSSSEPVEEPSNENDALVEEEKEAEEIIEETKEVTDEVVDEVSEESAEADMTEEAFNEPAEENKPILHDLIEDESMDEEEVVTEEIHDDFSGETDQEKIERLEKKIAEDEEMIASLNKEKEEVSDQKLEAERLVEENRKVSEEKQNQLDQAIFANEELKAQINLLNAQNEEKIQAVKNEKEQLETELLQAKEANQVLSEQMDSISANNQSSLSSMEELEKDKSSLQEELDSIKAENEKLNQSIIEIGNEKDSRILSLEDRNKELDESLNQEKEKNENLATELNHLREESLFKDSENDGRIISLQNEKENLIKELEESKVKAENAEKALSDLKTVYEEEKKNYDQLDAQSGMTSDQLASLDDENRNLTKQLEDKTLELDELNQKYSTILLENEALAVKNDELKAKVEENEKNSAQNEVMNDKIASLESELEKSNSKVLSLNLENERINVTISSLQDEVDRDTRTILYLSLFGKKECYDDVDSYLKENGLDFNEENILSAFRFNPEWKNVNDSKLESINGEYTLVDEESISYLSEDKVRKDKAMNFYDQIFSLEKNEVSDFAGRFIRVSDYKKEESDYGWDYAMIDKSGKEEKDNIFIANLKTIRDYRFNSSFVSNGHTFEMVKGNGKYRIASSDFISDPYDFSEAIRVTKNNQSRKSPLVYLFIKVSGVSSSEPDRDALMEFFDLMDCSAKRTCPESFLEMKTMGYGKGNYAFITFDGNVQNCYKEVLDYAVLLNSYRREYWRQKKLNAVIILNEVDVPFSKRHLDFDALLTETKDDELRALRYEFNMVVIDSLIKKTIHIGPRIKDKLPLDQSMLKPSEIGGGNFAKMYRFDKKFNVYNFVFSLTHKEEENID